MATASSYTLTIQLQPAQAALGATTQVIAQLQGDDLDDKVIVFEIASGNAVFTDTGNSETTSITNGSGTCAVSLVCKSVSAGQVTAYLAIDPTVTDNKEYQYVGQAAFDPLKISGCDNAFNDGKSKLTASTRLIEDGTGKKASVKFTFVSGSALFVRSGKPTDTVWTDDDGTVAIDFTDTVAEPGIIAVCLPSDQEVKADATFKFLKLPGIKAQALVDLSPADGTSANIVEVHVADAKGQPYKGVDLVYSVGGDVTIVGSEPARARAVGATQTGYGKTGPTGKLEVSFTATDATAGTFEVWLAVNDSVRASAAYAFTNAWTAIANLRFGDAVTSALQPGHIYANGQHQAQIEVSFDLTNKAGAILPLSEQPDLQTVRDAVLFIDYDGKQLLSGQSDPEDGTPVLPGWAVSATGNDFEKISLIQTKDDNGDRIQDGRAYLTYYITGAPAMAGRELGVGLRVSPHPNGSPIYNAADGDFNFPAYLRAEDPPRYRADALDIVCRPVPHQGMDDNGPQNLAGPDDPGNFWRQWDYSVALPEVPPGSPLQPVLHRCQLAEGELMPENFCFSARSNGLYNYQAYFWPNNVEDANGSPVGGTAPRQTVQSPGTPPRSIPVSGASGALRFTLYAAFGHLSPDSMDCKPVNFTLFDQYGNSTALHLEPLLIPYKYDNTAIAAWRFIGDDFADAAPSTQPGYSDPVSLYNSASAGGGRVGALQDDKGEFPGPPVVLNKDAVRVTLTARPDADGGTLVTSHTAFDIAIQTPPYSGKSLFVTADRRAPVMVARSGSGNEWHLAPAWNANATFIATQSTEYVFCYGMKDSLVQNGETMSAVFATSFRPELENMFTWEFRP